MNQTNQVKLVVSTVSLLVFLSFSLVILQTSAFNLNTQHHLGNMGGSYISFGALGTYVDAGPQTSNGWTLTDSTARTYELNLNAVNVTVTHLDDKVMELVIAGSNTSSATVYNIADSSPVTVTGAAGWTYDAVTHTTTLPLVNVSGTVTVNWNQPSGQGGNPIGGDPASPSPSASPDPVPPNNVYIPSPNPKPIDEVAQLIADNSVSAFAVFIVLIVICAVYLIGNRTDPKYANAAKKDWWK
jgi:hypothetical protein